MDAFKAQLDRVRRQLAELTPSQRMLVGTLVAIMALTLLYWGRYAGSPEMVPVLDQVLADDDIGSINQQLDLAGVPHSVVAGKVMVPADRKTEVLANLMYAHALPSDTHSAFEEMTGKELNPFSSNTEREAVYNHATELELANIIGRWPGVALAHVVINNKNERHIEGSIVPTATVDIRTRGEVEHPKQLVRAAADGVAGSVSGLTTDNIRVILNGNSMRVPTAGTDSAYDGGNLIELKEQNEARLEQKVRNQFSFIPGLTVTVTCDVDNQTRVDTIRKFDKAGSISLPNSEHTRAEETSTTDAAPREPGAATNDGTNGPASVADAAGGPSSGPVTANTSSTNDEETKNENFVPTVDSIVHTPAGKGTVQAAAVCVPMSYVTSVYKQMNPGAKDPSDADLQRATAAEVAKLRGEVAVVVGLAATDRVSVETFPDAASAELTLAAAVRPTSSTVSVLAGHAKEIVVALLAVVSLGLMTQLARRSTMIPIVSPAGLGGLGFGAVAFDGGDDRAARPPPSPVAAAVPQNMEGLELDEQTVRTQQMLDQVSTLVKDDPDAAAALVKRWVTRA